MQRYSNQRQMCPWVMERLAEIYFGLFESLNFESVQDVKFGWKKGLIESNISDKMLDSSPRVKLEGSLPRVR